MKKNKGFSLVELIVVVAIMAVLMGILVPSLVRQANKSKRSVDLNTASEIERAMKRVLSTDTEIYNMYSGDTKANYSYTIDTSTTLDSVKNDKLTYEVLSDFGTIPKSKWKPGYAWKINYNGTTEEIHIYLVPSSTATVGYELFPNPKEYVNRDVTTTIVD